MLMHYGLGWKSGQLGSMNLMEKKWGFFVRRAVNELNQLIY
jgi:hypothetical protein